jgi:hypothetical protein
MSERRGKRQSSSRNQASTVARPAATRTAAPRRVSRTTDDADRCGERLVAVAESARTLDVDGDTCLSPTDAVLVVNYLNGALPAQLPAQYAAPEPRYDVDGDNNVTPIDAVLVINALNAASMSSADPPEAAASCNLVVTTTANSGPGSLREAINCANTDSILDTITFDIPGTGVKTISPTSALPTITAPVIIDGYTQPGASPNTNSLQLGHEAQGSNAVLLIEISAPTSSGNGLTINADNTTIRGLVINGFGIQVRVSDISPHGHSGIVIEGNYLGTNPAGTTAAGTSAIGVHSSKLNQ